MLSALRPGYGAGLVLVLVVTAGCGSPGASAGSSDSGTFAITTSQLFIGASNTSGRALVNIKVTIVPVGRATEFSTSYSRMEAGERRDFSLGEFRGNDGTPFNLRIHKPRSVRITASDINGQKYEVDVPWQ